MNLNNQSKKEVVRVLFSFLLISFITCASVSAQRTITGKVQSDDSTVGLPGVNVTVKNGNSGTMTDFDGNYSIEVPSNDATLVFSYIGFKTKEITVGNNSVVDVTLIEDVSSLDEVVIIGYGSQKKSDLTGSVSSIGEEDFNKGPISSPDQLFQGKVPGVQVLQETGEPGGGISINIRGAGSINAGSSPLYVIDGLPIDNSPVSNDTGVGVTNARSPRNPLSSINPANIESIEILKDASATAIYGSRGSNGVILITTKSGKQGEMKVSYTTSMGVQNVANELNILKPSEYRNVINAIIDEGGGPEDERVTEIQGNGTDWQDEIFVRNAIVQNHDISFSGGTATNTSLVSLNYFNQEGLVLGSSFKRYNARVNLKSEISDKFKIGLNLTTTYSKDEFAPVGFGTNEGAGVINAALYYDPSIEPKNESGEFQRSNFITVDNPLALATGIDSQGFNFRTLGTFYAEYFFMSELSFKINTGGDILNQRRDSYVGRETLIGAQNDGIGTRASGQQINYLIEGLLNFNKTYTNHSINGVLGITAQTFKTSGLTGTGFGFPSDATKTFNLELGNPTINQISSRESENSLLSYLGRVNYSFLDRYLVTASFRIDGSSRFGENNKFGYFPSFALGWKIQEEPFFSSLESTFSTLKARASWGETGNQDIGNLNSVSTLGIGRTTIIGGEFVSSVEPKRIPNPDLKWERTAQINLGLDFGLWKNRISGSVDWYKKTTTDMLLNLPTPTSTGFNSILTNIGSIENSGLEVALASNNLVGNFKWSSNASFTTINNKVTGLGGVDRIIQGSAGFSNQIFLIEEGSSLGTFFGYQIDGVWQSDDDLTITNDPVNPGDFKYRDVNGDNFVNAEDRVNLGKSIPDFIWSVTNNFEYKNFGLNVFIEGTNGASMLNNNLVDTYFPINLRRNRYAEPLLNRWTPVNPSITYPSFVAPLSQGQKSVNSYTVENADYIRLQSVSLSYNLPLSIKGLNSLTLNLTGQNLAVWTDYTGFDPGINPNGNAINRIDYNAYPLARTFSFGISASF
jgi:TonB-linked SusC/RagA family outer membrane protein